MVKWEGKNPLQPNLKEFQNFGEKFKEERIQPRLRHTNVQPPGKRKKGAWKVLTRNGLNQ